MSDRGVDRSPWCAHCDRSIRERDYAHKRIRFDEREAGPFCGWNCATLWLIRNDHRIDDSFLDYETVGEGPRLITDGGEQVGDGTHWKDQDGCQGCGQPHDPLRAVKIRGGGRDLLCYDCFKKALEADRIDPDDERYPEVH